MKDALQQLNRQREPRAAADLAWSTFWLLWQVVRWPVFAVLRILDPIATLVFGGFSVLCVVMAFFFRLSGAVPTLPFWTVLGIGIGSGLVLAFYRKLLQLFAQ